MNPNLSIKNHGGWKDLRKRYKMPSRLLLFVALSLQFAIGQIDAKRSSSVGKEFLLAADTVANELYFYSIPSMQMTGQIDNVRLAAHMGTLALPDGRLLMVDDKNVQFLALRVDASGKPSIAGSANIPAAGGWNRAAWGAVDPAFRYFAFSSDADDTPSQTVTVIDLNNNYALKQVEIPISKNSAGAYEEMHVYLAGNPLNLFVTTGEEVRGYLLSDVLQGTLTLTSKQAIPITSHGPVMGQGTQKLYSDTAQGLAILDLYGNQLQKSRVVPWGFNVSQNFRPHLSFDSTKIYGAINAVPAPAATLWDQTQNFISVMDLRTETSKLIPLGLGVVGRFALSSSFALFWNVHPFGDNAFLLDTDPSSETFQQITAIVPLAKLSNGPVAGQPTTGKEARAGNISPNGDWAFVTHGGDGLISAIKTSARRVAAVIHTPTPLSGGGYVVAVQQGTPVIDTHAR